MQNCNDEALEYVPFSTFTVSLGELITSGFDLGLNDYPIFDENYRPHLNQQITDAYWFREIGQETPALFRFMLRRKMNQIMPYYNQLYLSTKLDFDPLSNYDLTTTRDATSSTEETRDNLHNEHSNSTTTADNAATSEGRTVISNTPQMQLSGEDDYATNLTDSTTRSDSTANGSDTVARELTEKDKASANTIENYILHIAGYNGITGSQALQMYRETFLNIDVQIIEALSPIFFGLYSDYANYL